MRSDAAKRIEPWFDRILFKVRLQESCKAYLEISSLLRIIIIPSISFAVIPSLWENFTKAPPSFSRGKISVTFIGTVEGIARLTRVRGSHAARRSWLNFQSISGRLFSPTHGNRRTQLRFTGNISVIDFSRTISLDCAFQG